MENKKDFQFINCEELKNDPNKINNIYENIYGKITFKDYYSGISKKLESIKVPKDLEFNELKIEPKSDQISLENVKSLDIDEEKVYTEIRPYYLLDCIFESVHKDKLFFDTNQSYHPFIDIYFGYNIEYFKEEDRQRLFDIVQNNGIDIESLNKDISRNNDPLFNRLQEQFGKEFRSSILLKDLIFFDTRLNTIFKDKISTEKGRFTSTDRGIEWDNLQGIYSRNDGIIYFKMPDIMYKTLTSISITRKMIEKKTKKKAQSTKAGENFDFDASEFPFSMTMSFTYPMNLPYRSFDQYMNEGGFIFPPYPFFKFADSTQTRVLVIYGYMGFDFYEKAVRTVFLHKCKPTMGLGNIKKLVELTPKNEQNSQKIQNVFVGDSFILFSSYNKVSNELLITQSTTDSSSSPEKNITTTKISNLEQKTEEVEMERFLLEPNVDFFIPDPRFYFSVVPVSIAFAGTVDKVSFKGNNKGEVELSYTCNSLYDFSSPNNVVERDVIDTSFSYLDISKTSVKQVEVKSQIDFDSNIDELGNTVRVYDEKLDLYRKVNIIYSKRKGGIKFYKYPDETLGSYILRYFLINYLTIQREKNTDKMFSSTDSFDPYGLYTRLYTDKDFCGFDGNRSVCKIGKDKITRLDNQTIPTYGFGFFIRTHRGIYKKRFYDLPSFSGEFKLVVFNESDFDFYISLFINNIISSILFDNSDNNFIEFEDFINSTYSIGRNEIVGIDYFPLRFEGKNDSNQIKGYFVSGGYLSNVKTRVLDPLTRSDLPGLNGSNDNDKDWKLNLWKKIFMTFSTKIENKEDLLENHSSFTIKPLSYFDKFLKITEPGKGKNFFIVLSLFGSLLKLQNNSKLDVIKLSINNTGHAELTPLTDKEVYGMNNGFFLEQSFRNMISSNDKGNFNKRMIAFISDIVISRDQQNITYNKLQYRFSLRYGKKGTNQNTDDWVRFNLYENDNTPISDQKRFANPFSLYILKKIGQDSIRIGNPEYLENSNYADILSLLFKKYHISMKYTNMIFIGRVEYLYSEGIKTSKLDVYIKDYNKGLVGQSEKIDLNNTLKTGNFLRYTNSLYIGDTVRGFSTVEQIAGGVPIFLIQGDGEISNTKSFFSSCQSLGKSKAILDYIRKNFDLYSIQLQTKARDSHILGNIFIAFIGVVNTSSLSTNSNTKPENKTSLFIEDIVDGELYLDCVVFYRNVETIDMYVLSNFVKLKKYKVDNKEIYAVGVFEGEISDYLNLISEGTPSILGRKDNGIVLVDEFSGIEGAWNHRGKNISINLSFFEESIVKQGNDKEVEVSHGFDPTSVFDFLNKLCYAVFGEYLVKNESFWSIQLDINPEDFNKELNDKKTEFRNKETLEKFIKIKKYNIYYYNLSKFPSGESNYYETTFDEYMLNVSGKDFPKIRSKIFDDIGFKYPIKNLKQLNFSLIPTLPFINSNGPIKDLVFSENFKDQKNDPIPPQVRNYYEIIYSKKYTIQFLKGAFYHVKRKKENEMARTIVPLKIITVPLKEVPAIYLEYGREVEEFSFQFKEGTSGKGGITRQITRSFNAQIEIDKEKIRQEYEKMKEQGKKGSEIISEVIRLAREEPEKLLGTYSRLVYKYSYSEKDQIVEQPEPGEAEIFKIELKLKLAIPGLRPGMYIWFDEKPILIGKEKVRILLPPQVKGAFMIQEVKEDLFTSDGIIKQTISCIR